MRPRRRKLRSELMAAWLSPCYPGRRQSGHAHTVPDVALQLNNCYSAKTCAQFRSLEAQRGLLPMDFPPNSDAFVSDAFCSLFRYWLQLLVTESVQSKFAHQARLDT